MNIKFKKNQILFKKNGINPGKIPNKQSTPANVYVMNEFLYLRVVFISFVQNRHLIKHDLLPKKMLASSLIYSMLLLEFGLFVYICIYITIKLYSYLYINLML